MNPVSIPSFLTALLLGLLSFVCFGFQIVLSAADRPLSWMILAGIPPLLFSAFACLRGIQGFRGSTGNSRGLAIGCSMVGGLGLLFWIVLVPLMSVFALPALDADAPNPMLEQSEQQMRILIRGVKTFHQLHGRPPVKLEELVDKELVPLHVLYDPRDPLKNVPSYRITSPLPEDTAQWPGTPAMEGRWPDAEGRRLLGFWDEHIETIAPVTAP